MPNAKRSTIGHALLLVVLLVSAPPAGATEEAPVAARSFAADIPEPESIEKIREYTTSDEFLPSSVSYIPDSKSVPSPSEVLGHLVGAPDELSRTAEIHGYFQKLAESSDRVLVETIGTSEEGREFLLAIISDRSNLERLPRLEVIAGRLADPRVTGEQEMTAFVEEGRPFYYLLGGLHSPETGSPEMLMELAYRLAVSERPEIMQIRKNLVVLITPVIEVDGRDRFVEWCYRHLRGRDLTYEEFSEFRSPPYWGHYVYHDNNRDGMQQCLALTRAVHQTYARFRPQVLHDLHESLPLLYISTGHGPYSLAVDPVTINEWTQFAHHEAGALQAEGLPGVWVWGFWDGWWPGYLFSVGMNHNSVGRFYETFGNATAGTFDRDLKEIKFLDRPVTDAQWYRPWPPKEKVVWPLRNTVNYMQAGVLEALGYAALHDKELLRNFWIKGKRSLEKGRNESPHAWVFSEEQRDPARLAYLINQLRSQLIEVHRLAEDFDLSGETLPLRRHRLDLAASLRSRRQADRRRIDSRRGHGAGHGPGAPAGRDRRHGEVFPPRRHRAEIAPDREDPTRKHRGVCGRAGLRVRRQVLPGGELARSGPEGSSTRGCRASRSS